MNPSFDLIRVIAIFLVVLNHVSSWCQYYNADWRIYNIYQSIVSIGVPVFFIISGRLLLNKDEPIKEFFKKRFNKIIIPFISWSYIYLVYQKYVPLLPWQRIFASDQVSFNPIGILTGQTYGHLWFIYSLISLYLPIPIFRKLCSNISNSYLYYLLLLWVGYSIQTNISKVFTFNATPISLSFLTLPYAGFLFLGYLLSKNEFTEKFTIKISSFMWLICTIITFLLTNWHTSRIGTNSSLFWLPDSPFVILASLSLFGFIQQLSIPKGMQTFIKSLSNSSLGIFFCHMIFIYIITTMPINLFIALRPIFSIPTVAILCFILSYILTLIIKKVHFIRKIV